MKSLESSQEIIFFQDALNGLQMDFSVSDPKILSKIVDEISDILKCIEEMCESDEKFVDEIQNELHYLLLNKTLLSCEEFKDEERKRFYAQICSYMPKLSWNLYIKIIANFSWLNLAEKSWIEEPVETRMFIFESILKVTKIDSDVKNTQIFYAVLRELMNLTDDEETFQRCFQLISDTIEQQTELEALEALIDTLTHFSTVSVPNHKLNQQLFELLIRWNYQKFRELPLYCEIKTNLLNCCVAMEKIINSNTINFQLLNEFHTALSQQLTTNYVDEEDIFKDLKIIESKVEHSEGSLIRVIDYLKANESLKSHLNECLECLRKNFSVLKPNHVVDLLKFMNNPENDENILSCLMQIIESAFKSWSLKVQDNFRGEFHRDHFSIQLFAQSSSSSSFGSEITGVTNLLASTSELEKLNNITNDLSFLCLKNPSKTLTFLMNFAVESGQGKIVAEIFKHLLTSFENVIDNQPLGISILLNLIEDPNLTTNQLTNLSSLIREMLINEILKPEEFLRNTLCNFNHNFPCYKKLLIISETITTACDEDWKVICDDSLIWVLLLTLGRILNYCSTVNLNEFQSNVLSAKQHAIHVIQIISRRLHVSDYLKGHNLCWLYTKFQPMHSSVLNYFEEIFSFTEFKAQLIPKVNTTLDELLEMICSSENEAKRKQYLDLYSTNNKQSSQSSFHLTVEVAKLLPRMTESESRNLVEVLIRLTEDEKKQYSPVEVVYILLNSMQFLIQSCKDLQPPFYMQSATANCSTIIKEIITSGEQNISNSQWILIVYMVVKLTDQLGTIKKHGELLLIHLFKMKSSINDKFLLQEALKVVEKLNNQDLSDQVNKMIKID
ncbi:hypothetical protein CHUAL_006112 [Chamberlinius hualienensis]